MNWKEVAIQCVAEMSKCWTSPSYSKFKDSEKVFFYSLRGRRFDGTIIKSNHVSDKDGIEYAITDYPYLVWEDELHKGE
jgi:hypothetical protein